MPAKVPAKWVRGPADELAIREGCRFDQAAADYVVEFLSGFCCQSKGDWAGKPLDVIDWQWDFLARLYGWMRPDGTRRYRKAYLEVPKKNGKSTLVSGLSLYHLIADGEAGPEVYINAYDRSQASIIFDEAKRMVDASPALERILDPVPSNKRIEFPGRNGILRANSADVPSKDGVNASFVIFDELHRQRTPALWRIFRYAGASRRQPLTLSITTAGCDRTSVCWQEHLYTERVNSGEVKDPYHLGVIYGAGPGDDYRDPATWAKANPSLGITLKAEDFQSELNECEGKPSELGEFLRLRLNVWTSSEARFLDRVKWDAAAGPVKAEVPAVRQACYAGGDLASTTDLAAMAFLFPDGEGDMIPVVRAYLPEATAEEKARKNDTRYRQWAEEGWLTLTPGSVIDYEFIYKDVLDIADRHDLRSLYLDPYNATQLGVMLQGAGVNVVFIRQGFLSLSPPTKELERLVIAGQLPHGANPILDWCADNAMAVKDAAGNLKLDKSKSGDKIDLLAALVNAIAAATADDQAGASVYSPARGIITLG